MHPYSGLSNKHFWKRFVAAQPWRDLPLADDAKFRLKKSDKISTAGSCFAQHISRYLQGAGYHTYLAERPHPLIAQHGGEVDSYQLFSARYGNIYTARQCLELFRQAFGVVPVIEDFVEEKGRFYDLLRPNAVPDGFANLNEARADRLYHLACVRNMFLVSDVFIFTLGLTESWYHAQAGHTYPVCPGTARGQYDPAVHQFRNLNYSAVMADLDALIQGLLTVNPALRVILTVSPVPLVATYTQTNVLVASSYSKSVLRAVAGEIETRYDHVAYFPSYEMISHPASFGQYLESDLRGVAERGVAHVMGCFLSTFLSVAADSAPDDLPTSTPPEPLPVLPFLEAECEEIFNEVVRT